MHVLKMNFFRNYPDVIMPNNSAITRIITHLRECGAVAGKKRTGRQAILTFAELAELRNVMEPSKRLQRLSAESQISYGSAKRAFEWSHYGAYHVQIVQELKEPNKQKRVHG
ncbi:hypothetical protein C0J52_09915 [Blattella germanica]|nr:hypothetical protein C0J52_09915 [Blattella germanica]